MKALEKTPTGIFLPDIPVSRICHLLRDGRDHRVSEREVKMECLRDMENRRV